MTTQRTRKLMSWRAKSPTLKPLIEYSERFCARPPKRPIKGLMMSSISAWTSFCAAPPRINPMANPATPRSRIKPTNPSTLPFGPGKKSSRSSFLSWGGISKSIQLHSFVDGFVDEAVGVFVLLATHMGKTNGGKMRDDEIVDFHILRPERLFFYLILIRHLPLDEFGSHPHFDIARGEPAFLRFGKRKDERFVFGPIVGSLA